MSPPPPPNTQTPQPQYLTPPLKKRKLKNYPPKAPTRGLLPLLQVCQRRPPRHQGISVAGIQLQCLLVAGQGGRGVTRLGEGHASPVLGGGEKWEGGRWSWGVGAGKRVKLFQQQRQSKNSISVHHPASICTPHQPTAPSKPSRQPPIPHSPPTHSSNHNMAHY